MTGDRSRSKLQTAHIAAVSFGNTAGGLAILAMASFLAFAPSSTYAQTLNLGQAGADGIFAVYDSALYNQTFGATGTGAFNFSSSTDMGGAMLGAYTSIAGSGTIHGSLSADPSATFSGVNVMGSTNSSPALGTYIAGLGQTAINTATTAEGWSTSGANVLNNTGTGNNYVFTGSANNSGNNVININASTNSGLLSTSSNGTYTITLNGTASEQFVFNITGIAHQQVTWNNINIILNGVSANNVFYNFIYGGSGIGINNSNLVGTVINLVSGTGMSIDGSIVEGTVISDGFVDLSQSIVAPELPTIMMAGLASVVVFGHAAFGWRRRQRHAKS